MYVIVTRLLASDAWWNFIILDHFITEIGKCRYTVIPFGATVAGDVFQHKLHQCFGMIKQVTVIADDIVIVGKQQNHRDHDVVLTTLIDTAGKCNVKLNFDKLQYKKTGVNFFGENIHHKWMHACPKQSICFYRNASTNLYKRKCSHLLEWSIIYKNSHWDCQSLWSQLGNFPGIKYL